jgi:hypothetical protein
MGKESAFLLQGKKKEAKLINTNNANSFPNGIERIFVVLLLAVANSCGRPQMVKWGEVSKRVCRIRFASGIYDRR